MNLRFKLNNNYITQYFYINIYIYICFSWNITCFNYQIIGKRRGKLRSKSSDDSSISRFLFRAHKFDSPHQNLWKFPRDHYRRILRHLVKQMWPLCAFFAIGCISKNLTQVNMKIWTFSIRHVMTCDSREYHVYFQDFYGKCSCPHSYSI